MKKIMAVVLAGAIATAGLLGDIKGISEIAVAEAASGTPISDLNGLLAINNNPSGTYYLTNDIDMSGYTEKNRVPIPKFSGTLEGNGYRIKGLTFSNADTTCNGAGLIDDLEEAKVSNLALTNVSIHINNEKDTTYCIGSLAVCVYKSTIENVYVTGDIKIEDVTQSHGVHRIGGLIGRNLSGDTDSWYQTKINNCYNACNISYIDTVSTFPTAYLGGIIANSEESEMSLCECVYNIGKITLNGSIESESAFGEISSSSQNSFYLEGTAGKGIYDESGRLSDLSMRNPVYFTGFDFDNVWMMDPESGYPYPQLINNAVDRIKKVELTKKPTITEYYVGEKIDLEEGEITVTYESGRTRKIPTSELKVSGFDSSHAGDKTITLTYGSKWKVSYRITIKGIPVDAMSFKTGNLSLNVGNTKTLAIQFTPKTATEKTLSFKSSNPSVATVDKNGKVKARAIGKTAITATAPSGAKATCTVVVKKEITNKMVTWKLKSSYRYNGKAKKPKAAVYDNAKRLKAGKDYSISYKKNVGVGTATIIIKGKGDYTGTVKKYFTIK